MAIHSIRAVLKGASADLKALALDAVQEDRFQDVALIAEYTARLNELIEALEEDEGDGSEASSGFRSTRSSSNGAGRRRHQARKRSYPRFEREADRLIKIGWSKKEGDEYSHKAPKTAVDRVLSVLGQLDGNRVFTMDDILPELEDDDGPPSYQVYLVMAWLRSFDAVLQEERGEYRVSPERVTPDAVEARWNALPKPEG